MDSRICAIDQFDRTAFEEALADPDFGTDAWLTFYLAGEPAAHEAMREDLARLGARNLDGADSGFVYAKVPVQLTEKDMERRINVVRKLAIGADVDIAIIDLDTSLDVEKSKFVVLWKDDQ